MKTIFAVLTYAAVIAFVGYSALQSLAGNLGLVLPF